MARKVPVGRSRLAWRGIVVNRLLAGRHQISCEPAAGRTNSHPRRRSFFVSARYVMPSQEPEPLAETLRPPTLAAAELPWNASRSGGILRFWGRGEALRQWNRPEHLGRGVWDSGQENDRPPAAQCAAAIHSLPVWRVRFSHLKYSKSALPPARSVRAGDPASRGGITGTQMGLIADEVQRVFPQWVGRDRQDPQSRRIE